MGIVRLTYGCSCVGRQQVDIDDGTIVSDIIDKFPPPAQCRYSTPTINGAPVSGERLGMRLCDVEAPCGGGGFFYIRMCRCDECGKHPCEKGYG